MFISGWLSLCCNLDNIKLDKTDVHTENKDSRFQKGRDLWENFGQASASQAQVREYLGKTHPIQKLVFEVSIQINCVWGY